MDLQKTWFFSLLFLCLLLNGLTYIAASAQVPDQEEKHLTPNASSNHSAIPADGRENSLHVLVIDGGGTRGVVAVRFIEHILYGMGPAHEFFRGGITGTSTGSFIALALTAPRHTPRRTGDTAVPDQPKWGVGPYTLQEVMEFYESVASEVFVDCTFANCMNNCCLLKAALLAQDEKISAPDAASRASTTTSCDPLKSCCTTACNLLKSCTPWSLLSCLFSCNGCCAVRRNCNGWCGPKYSNQGLRKLLTEKFDKMELHESLAPVQIVAYDIELGVPVYFNSVDHPNMLMVDAALASSAAPTYFPPIYIDKDSNRLSNFYTCIDGGIVDNSAGMAAIRFGMTNFQQNFFPSTLGDMPRMEDLLVVSVGTGFKSYVSRSESLNRAGLLGWAKTSSMSRNGFVQATHSNLSGIYSIRSTIINENGLDGVHEKHYFRFQIKLAGKEASLDNTSTKIMNSLTRQVSIGFEPGGDYEERYQGFRKAVKLRTNIPQQTSRVIFDLTRKLKEEAPDLPTQERQTGTVPLRLSEPFGSIPSTTNSTPLRSPPPFMLPIPAPSHHKPFGMPTLFPRPLSPVPESSGVPIRSPLQQVHTASDYRRGGVLSSAANNDEKPPITFPPVPEPAKRSTSTAPAPTASAATNNERGNRPAQNGDPRPGRKPDNHTIDIPEGSLTMEG